MTKTMKLSIIAGIGKNNELGKGNQLLWHMPADMKYFRETTAGHTVIMGRKTFESIGRPLPKRRNIVITRSPEYQYTGIEIAPSLEEAIKKATGDGEIFVIGGAEIYAQAMELAEKLYITHINAEDASADTFFPEIIPVVWNEISREEHKADSENPHDYTFSVYERFF